MYCMSDSQNNGKAHEARGTEAANELRSQANRDELIERLARAVPGDGTMEVMPGLHMSRSSTTIGPIVSVAHPSFCVIAQGTKDIYLGEERYRYDPYHYLLATVELPVIIHLTEACAERPYLGLRLDLDTSLVASVMLEAGLPTERREAFSARALDVSPLDANLLDAAVRLVRLAVEQPAEARVLRPLITREIVFRLLRGAQGARLRHIAVLGGHAERIARAIERLRHGYDKPLRIASLAREFGMSASGFHEHFKAVTAMSPLQFQKQLRLQEARRLMLGEDMDAASAAFRVGYEDTSHFSREYKRFFGAPPMRDVERLRDAAMADSLK